MHIAVRLSAMVGAIALAAAPAAVLAGAVAPQAVEEAPVSDGATLKGDVAVLEAASASARSGGPKALAEHVPALTAALGHAPRPFSKYEWVAGKIYIRATSTADYLLATAQLRAERRPGDPVTETVWLVNPYPFAALYLGLYHLQAGDADAAHKALDAGLEIAPEDPNLINQKGVALVGEKRWEDAHALYSKALEIEGLGGPDRARLMRGKGYTLIELGDLDEAEKAYRDSLKLQANHPDAMKELEFITARRKAAASAPAPASAPEPASAP